MNAFYIPDRVVDRGGDSTIESFVVHLPSIETVGLPPYFLGRFPLLSVPSDNHPIRTI
jgi:hypothetical protein